MSIDIPLWASEDNSPEKKNVSGAAADTVYDFVRLATRWQISAAGSRDILCARNRICSGTGQICAKILDSSGFCRNFFGFSNLDRIIFVSFRFRTSFFYFFQLSTENFFGFSNFEPEKIPEISDRGCIIPGRPPT